MAQTYTQNYKDVKSSRSFGVWYKNESLEDLFVILNVAGRGVEVAILPRESSTPVILADAPSGLSLDSNDRHNYSFVVRPNDSYRITSITAQGVSSWTEMSSVGKFALPLCLSEVRTELQHPSTFRFCMDRTDSRSYAGIPTGRLCLSNFVNKSSSPNTLTVDLLIVGGGGGGGMGAYFGFRVASAGGGGGGGGVVRETGRVLSGRSGTIPIIIGQGGMGATNIDVSGSVGSSTTAFGLTAYGGGGGASARAAAPATQASGGGGAGSTTIAGNFAAGVGGPQGFPGGGVNYLGDTDGFDNILSAFGNNWVYRVGAGGGGGAGGAGDEDPGPNISISGGEGGIGGKGAFVENLIINGRAIPWVGWGGGGSNQNTNGSYNLLGGTTWRDLNGGLYMGASFGGMGDARPNLGQPDTSRLGSGPVDANGPLGAIGAGGGGGAYGRRGGNGSSGVVMVSYTSPIRLSASGTYIYTTGSGETQKYHHVFTSSGSFIYNTGGA